MESAAQFRTEAAKCRALAKVARDKLTANNLRALAEDYDAEAERLEGALSAQPPLRPAD